MNEYQDMIITCVGVPGKSCGKEFTHSAGAQKMFAEKGFQKPKRCKECRQEFKESKRFQNK